MNNLNLYKKLTIKSLITLKKSGLRSFLTLLGIFIGSATIVLVYELGIGAQASIEEQYSNMSVNTIIINAPSTGGVRSKLSIDDIPDLINLSVIESAAPQLTGKLVVSHSTNSVSLNIFGTSPNIKDIVNLELIEGKFFTEEESSNRQKVVVLGYDSAEELFGEEFSNIVGEKVTINRKTYEIVGVLKYKGGSFGPVTIDDSIFIPFGVAERYLLGKPDTGGGGGKFNINLIVDNFENLASAQEQITLKLRELHGIRGNIPEDFKIKDMGSVVQSAQESARTMSVLLWSVGLIVLIVGGIGIMNIMYTSVLERTKEIGILKALGARDVYVLYMFLSEAVILSFIGFVVGALLSFLIYFGVTKTGFTISFEPVAYLISLVSTMGIGTVFGYYPAKKASSLNPVDALRYE